MEHDTRGEPDSGAAGAATDDAKPAAAARSHSVVHYVDRSPESAARLVAGLLERIDASARTPRCLVIVPGPDDATALAEAVAAIPRERPRASLAPLTSVVRGRRQLAAGAAVVLGGAPELAALLRESRLAVGQVALVVLAWPEEVLPDERLAALETVLADLPKSAERVAIAAAHSAELDGWLERVMWRARAVDHLASGHAAAGRTVRVLATVESERGRALRTLMDALDPAKAVFVAGTAAGEASARRLAEAIGGPPGTLIEVRREPAAEPCDLLVLFDESATPDAVAASSARETVAVIRPARADALRRSGLTTLPVVWSGAAAAARTAQDQLRDEIRGTIAGGAHAPWVLAVEPLLGEADPVEVAAAAIALLDRERRRARRQAAAPAPVARPAAERRGPATGRGESGARPSKPSDRPGRPFDRRPGSPGRNPEERPRGGPRRRDDIERVPRAARERDEWSGRGERLRQAKRQPGRGAGGRGDRRSDA